MEGDHPCAAFSVVERPDSAGRMPAGQHREIKSLAGSRRSAAPWACAAGRHCTTKQRRAERKVAAAAPGRSARQPLVQPGIYIWSWCIV